MNKVVIFKLVSGEEIIGTQVGVTEESELIIEDMLHLITRPGPNGQLGVGMIPFSPITNSRKTLQPIHIIFLETPESGLEQEYRKNTGKIVTPPTSIITRG